MLHSPTVLLLPAQYLLLVDLLECLLPVLLQVVLLVDLLPVLQVPLLAVLLQVVGFAQCVLL